MEQQTMGRRIARKRRELNLTQAELAEKMGVTDKAVSKWERDLSCPDVAVLPKLAQFLGVTADELLACRTEMDTGVKKNEARNLAALICKAVGTAMGAAVAVLSFLKQIDTASAVSLLGIGVFALGLCQLMHPDKGADESRSGQV